MRARRQPSSNALCHGEPPDSRAARWSARHALSVFKRLQSLRGHRSCARSFATSHSPRVCCYPALPPRARRAPRVARLCAERRAPPRDIDSGTCCAFRAGSLRWNRAMLDRGNHHLRLARMATPQRVSPEAAIAACHSRPPMIASTIGRASSLYDQLAALTPHPSFSQPRHRLRASRLASVRASTARAIGELMLLFFTRPRHVRRGTRTEPRSHLSFKKAEALATLPFERGFLASECAGRRKHVLTDSALHLAARVPYSPHIHEQSSSPVAPRRRIHLISDGKREHGSQRPALRGLGDVSPQSLAARPNSI